MGKPFKKELRSINSTIDWSNKTDIEPLKSALLCINSPIYIVGSGGSLSTCAYLEELYQEKGRFAAVLTPLEFLTKKTIRRESTIIFISASGKNKDIVFAYNEAVNRECSEIISITMRDENQLSLISKKYSITSNFNFSIPTKKDGFLATNTLVAYFVILYRVFKEATFNLEKSNDHEKYDFSFNKQTTLVLLYSRWSKAVAQDFESKCSEAGIGASILSDYRNFGHGRHNWFDKQKDTILIAFNSLEDKSLSDKTLDVLPKDIVKIRLQSQHYGAKSSINLLINSFKLIDYLGSLVNIDPGRPGVPLYGRILYNLSYRKTITNSRSIEIPKSVLLSIQRKYGILNSNTSYNQIYTKYKEFIKSINSVKFGMIVFDYDATLISKTNKTEPINSNIASFLNGLLGRGLLLGVASGRGKSLRKSLQEVIEKKYWNKVLVGYYNASSISLLEDNTAPIITEDFDSDLISLYNELRSDIFLRDLEIDLRPNQLSVFLGNNNLAKSRMSDVLSKSIYHRLKKVESSHSIDIIPNRISKLLLLEEAKIMLNELKLNENILKIGDKGKFPGNDHDLLSSPFSLSVDEVSSDPNTCWNLAPKGIKWNDATLYYLLKISLSDGYFKTKF